MCARISQRLAKARAGKKFLSPVNLLATLAFQIVFQQTIFAQAPPFEWVRQAGGPRNDSPNGIATDGSGNIFVTGSFARTASFGTQTITGINNDNPIAFIAKYKSDGTVDWVRG